MSIVITKRPLPPPPVEVTALQFRLAASIPQSEYPPHLRPSNPRQSPWISQAEALAWESRLELPQIVLDIINTLPTEERHKAHMAAIGMNKVVRTDQLINIALAVLNATEEDRDALFRFAETL